MQQPTERTRARPWLAALMLAALPPALTYAVYFVPWLGKPIVSLSAHVDASFCVYEIARAKEVGLRYWELADDPAVGKPYPTGAAKHPGLFEGLDFLAIGATAARWLEPVAAFLFAVGALIAINGWIVGGLVYRSTGSFGWSAIAASLMVCNLPIALRAPVHPNLLKVGYSVLAVWCYLGLVRRPTMGRGIQLGLAMALLLQGSYYLAYLTAVGLTAAFALDLVFRRVSARHIVPLGAAVATFAPLALAIAFPVIRQAGMPLAKVYFERDIAGVWHYSAELWQYLRPYPSNTPHFNWGGMNFPGYAVIVAFFALGIAWLRRWPVDAPARRVSNIDPAQSMDNADDQWPSIAMLATFCGIFVVLSMRGGPGVWLFSVVKSYRCYDRAGLIAVGLGIATTGLLGARFCRLANRRGAIACGVAGLLLTVGDVISLPTHLARVERRRDRMEVGAMATERQIPGWAEWLKVQPREVSIAAFGELQRGDLLEDYWHWESLYLRCAVHGHRTLNGCEIKLLDADLHQLGASYAAMTPDGLRFVASLGYRCLAFDAGYLAAHPWIAQLDWLTPAANEKGWHVFAVKPSFRALPQSTLPAIAAAFDSQSVRRTPPDAWITEAVAFVEPCIRVDDGVLRAAWYDAKGQMIGKPEPVLAQRCYSGAVPFLRAKTPRQPGIYAIVLLDDRGKKLAGRSYEVDASIRRLVATASDKLIDARMEADGPRDAKLILKNGGPEFIAAKLGPKRSKTSFEFHPALGDHYTVNTIYAATWTPDDKTAPPVRTVGVVPADIPPQGTLAIPLRAPANATAGRWTVGFEFVGPADRAVFSTAFSHGLQIGDRFIAAAKPVAATGGDHFVTREFGALPVAPGRTFVGDFDGDKKDDLAHFEAATGIWNVLPTRTPPVPAGVWASWSTAVHWGDILVGDFNGDGKADIAAQDGDTGAWYVGVSTGKGLSTTQWAPAGPCALADLRVRDVDGDGKADIEGIADAAKSRREVVWLSRGSTFEGPLNSKQLAALKKPALR